MKKKKKPGPGAKRHALFNVRLATEEKGEPKAGPAEEKGEPKAKIGKRPPMIARY